MPDIACVPVADDIRRAAAKIKGHEVSPRVPEDDRLFQNQ